MSTASPTSAPEPIVILGARLINGSGHDPIDNAALLIEDGRIVAVGSSAEIAAKAGPNAEVIDAEGRCVTPGFVDAHTHLVFAGNRADEFEQRIAGATYQEIAAAGGGILRTVRLTRAASDVAVWPAP